MSALVTINIEGLGEVPVHSEYTDPAVKDAYAANIQPIIDAFNRGRLVLDDKGNLVAADPSVGGSLSAADVQAIKDALPILLGLAQNGLEVGGKTYYLTIEMGQAVQLIQSGLESAGFNPSATDADNIVALKRWQDMANVGMEDIVLNAGAAVFSNKSLQSLIELEYVKTGNEVIGGNLNSLRDALEVTKNILNILEKIQDLHNLISVPEKDQEKSDALQAFLDRARSGGFSYSTIKQFTDQWEPLADEYFDYISATINPDYFKEVTSDAGNKLIGVTDETVAKFLQYREELSRQLAILRNINGTPVGGPDEEGSLAEKLQTVLDDMALNSSIETKYFIHSESNDTGLEIYLTDVGGLSESSETDFWNDIDEVYSDVVTDEDSTVSFTQSSQGLLGGAYGNSLVTLYNHDSQGTSSFGDYVHHLIATDQIASYTLDGASSLDDFISGNGKINIVAHRFQPGGYINSYATISQALSQIIQDGYIQGNENPFWEVLTNVYNVDSSQTDALESLDKGKLIELYQEENGSSTNPSDNDLKNYLEGLLANDSINGYAPSLTTAEDVVDNGQSITFFVAKYREGDNFTINQYEPEVNENHEVALWITDRYDVGDSIDSGNIQRHLTEGITSGESLNDKQKEDLRRFMFVFEEYYKSASSILQSITRMVERMAQGIKQ